jgi:hypothetical protein
LGQLRVDVGPLGGEGEGHLAPHLGAVQFPDRWEPLRRWLLWRWRRSPGRW